MLILPVRDGGGPVAGSLRHILGYIISCLGGKWRETDRQTEAGRDTQRDTHSQRQRERERSTNTPIVCGVVFWCTPGQRSQINSSRFVPCLDSRTGPASFWGSLGHMTRCKG